MPILASDDSQCATEIQHCYASVLFIMREYIFHVRIQLGICMVLNVLGDETFNDEIKRTYLDDRHVGIILQ